MENNMFCFQCQETAKGFGCTLKGVCGKNATTARTMDLLLFVVRGISVVADQLRQHSLPVEKEVDNFIVDALFCTITNANFDDESITKRIDKGLAIRDDLKHQASAKDIPLPEADELNWKGSHDEYDAKAATVGVLREQNEDLRSLKELIMYGLKGMAAYLEHAMRLGHNDESIHRFMQNTIAQITTKSLSADELTALALKTGEIGVRTMALLDKANTSRYGNPEITHVNIGTGTRPGILISGHDLHDLEELLEQTKDSGVDVYTHGEMLPSHGYAGLKKYPHLIGNFGGAWQDQQKEFDNLPGCIIMTTNCLMRPRDSYKDRIYSTNVVGWEGVKHIEKKSDGEKDFSPVIRQALELGGFKEDIEPHNILVGFGHEAVLSNAQSIVDAVKSGHIRHFFLIGGCDGARPGRNYYTEFAKLVPNDCIIMTLACGKYRFNKLDFGEAAGIPRLLDIGQCNDAYSAVRIATALADAFETDINGLPLSLIISWYEQKAVADLLALLSLGFKNIYLGPTLPAFISPNVTDTFNLRLISNAEDDIKTCLRQAV